MNPEAAADQLTLALERTWLAHERTLMAWIRTATSLIAFGFGIYKFVFFMHAQQPDKAVDHVLGARNLGMAMIGIGIAALGLATWQHAYSTRRFRAHFAQAPYSLALVLAALIAGFGIVAFVATLLRE